MMKTILAGAPGIVLGVVLGGAPLLAQPKVSKAEGEAYNAMVVAMQKGDADATIQAAQDLITKFKDTQFKAVAFMVEAQAYKGKGDLDHAQTYAEQALAADPKNFQAPLLIGEAIVTTTKENDLDKDDRLKTAEKDLNLCIENIKAAAKPNPALPDAQWEEAKRYTIANAQADLGRVQVLRKKPNDAIPQLQAAVDADPQPAYQVWLASAQQQAGKNSEAIATCDKIIASNAPAAYKDAANAVKKDAQAKGGK